MPSNLWPPPKAAYPVTGPGEFLRGNVELPEADGSMRRKGRMPTCDMVQLYKAVLQGSVLLEHIVKLKSVYLLQNAKMQKCGRELTADRHNSASNS